jgi:hypothetical protein
MRLGGHRAALIALLLGAVSPFNSGMVSLSNYSLDALSALSLLSFSMPGSIQKVRPLDSYVITAILRATSLP